MSFILQNIKTNIILAFLLFSSVAYSQRNDSLQYKRFFERKLTKSIIEAYCGYENISLKMDAKVIMPDKTFNLNILVRIIKDSALWINVNHNTGIPVARLLVTKDSTKILNRRENEYLEISNEQIIEKFKYDISYNMLEAIFTAQLINLEPDKKIIKTYRNYKVYDIADSLYLMQNIKKKRISRLIKKAKIDEFYIHEVRISPSFKIVSTCIEDNENQQKIFVEYPEYSSDNSCVKKINIVLSNNKQETKIRLKVKRVKKDKESLRLPFKIPSKYTKATLNKEKE